MNEMQLLLMLFVIWVGCGWFWWAGIRLAVKMPSRAAMLATMTAAFGCLFTAAGSMIGFFVIAVQSISYMI